MGEVPQLSACRRVARFTFDNLCRVFFSAEISRAQSHSNGQDMAVWRQDGDDSNAPPQVSKAWDDRRRITAFTWESADPTAEQETIKGVFAAAVASLQESGFAIARAISRMKAYSI